MSGRKRRAAARRAERRGGAPGRAAPILFFGAAGLLVVVLVVTVVALFVVGRDGPAQGSAAAAPPVGESGVTPSSYSSSPSTRAYAAIAQRSADPRPLTEHELFAGAAAKIESGRSGPGLKAKRLDGDCGQAVWGPAVGAELRRGGCAQAARASYATRKGAADGYALTVAVFNLNGVQDADRVVGALDHGRGGGFVKPLDEGFGRGFSMARGLAMGHYAVVVWAQRLDGKGDPADDGLLSLLIEGGKSPAVLGRAAGAGR